MGVGPLLPLLQRGESDGLPRPPPRTSPVAEIWLRWKRLFDRACEVATPIGLDDARTHVQEFFVGSSIHGDNLTCRLARKLRQVEERFEAARLDQEAAAANSRRGETMLDLVPVPWRTRAVHAMLCVSVAHAGLGRGMKVSLSLHINSTGETFVIFGSSQTRSRWVRLSLMRLALANPSDRVLALATRAASSTSAATDASGMEPECCLLFDDNNSLKRFTAMCNGY